MGFLRVIHFTGKLFGRTKEEFVNHNGDPTTLTSISFLGFSVYKVSTNTYRFMRDILTKGETYFDSRLIEHRAGVEATKTELWENWKEDYQNLKNKNDKLVEKNSKLSSAVLNLKYSARTVIEDFDDLELEELI